MRCDEFKNRIEELFDLNGTATGAETGKAANPDTTTNDLLEHIASCDSCRKYYQEFETVVGMLTPKDLSEESKPAAKSHTLRRRLSVAAAVAAIICGIGFYVFPTTGARAAGATALFSGAIKAIGRSLNMSATLMVRTLPDENFNYIDAEAPFVEHRLSAATDGTHRTWSLSKGDRHYVVCDGQAQYQWWTDRRKAAIQPVTDNVIDYFAMIADIAQLMGYEKVRAEQRSGDSYLAVRTDSTITLTVTSGAKYNPHPLLGRNHSQDYLDNIREYTFDSSSSRLLGLRFWVVADGKKQLILYTRNIAYGAEATLPHATAIPHDSHSWTDTRPAAEAGKPSQRLSALQKETAAEAARRIITAITSNDGISAREALATYDTDALFAQYSGHSLVAVEDTFRSDGYAGIYAVTEMQSPDGRRHKLRLALRNDNEQGIWLLDGGI